MFSNVLFLIQPTVQKSLRTEVLTVEKLEPENVYVVY